MDGTIPYEANGANAIHLYILHIKGIFGKIFKYILHNAYLHPRASGGGQKLFFILFLHSIVLGIK